MLMLFCFRYFCSEGYLVDVIGKSLICCRIKRVIGVLTVNGRRGRC